MLHVVFAGILWILSTMPSWLLIYHICYSWCCMLSVASRYFGQVDACDSKREYLCSIVGFMPPFLPALEWQKRARGGWVVATSEKTMVFVSKDTSICLHCTLFLMQLSIACNLIPRGVRMISRGWIITHRCSWMAVYVSCCNARTKYHICWGNGKQGIICRTIKPDHWDGLKYG